MTHLSKGMKYFLSYKNKRHILIRKIIHEYPFFSLENDFKVTKTDDFHL